MQLPVPNLRLRKLFVSVLLILVVLALLFFLRWDGAHKTSDSPKTGHAQSNVEPAEALPQTADGSGIPLVNSTPNSIPIATRDAVITHAQSSVRLDDRSKVLVCYVSKSTGQPVTAGKVKIEPMSESPALDLELPPSGCIQFLAPVGRYILRSICPGYHIWSDHVDVLSAPESVEATIKLSRTTILRGRIRNDDGKVQPGAKVFICMQGAGTFWGESGAGGLFDIETYPGIADRIYAFLPQHPIASAGPIRIAEDQNRSFEITLPRTEEISRLTGRVVQEGNTPIVGAGIRIETQSNYHVADPRHDFELSFGDFQYPSTATDAGGHFSIDVIPQRDVKFFVRAEGFEPYSETLDMTQDREKQVKLKLPQYFNVAIEDATGRPIPGMHVVGITQDLKHVVYATSEEGKYFATEYPFTIYAYDDEKRIGFTVRRMIPKFQEDILLKLGDAQIAGSAVDESGKPVNELRISVGYWGEDSTRGYTGYMELWSPNGSFLVSGLVPGQATIRFSSSSPAGRMEFSQNLTIEANQRIFLRPVLKLQ